MELLDTTNAHPRLHGDGLDASGMLHSCRDGLSIELIPPLVDLHHLTEHTLCGWRCWYDLRVFLEFPLSQACHSRMSRCAARGCGLAFKYSSLNEALRFVVRHEWSLFSSLGLLPTPSVQPACASIGNTFLSLAFPFDVQLANKGYKMFSNSCCRMSAEAILFRYTDCPYSLAQVFSCPGCVLSCVRVPTLQIDPWIIRAELRIQELAEQAGVAPHGFLMTGCTQKLRPRTGFLHRCATSQT